MILFWKSAVRRGGLQTSKSHLRLRGSEPKKIEQASTEAKHRSTLNRNDERYRVRWRDDVTWLRDVTTWRDDVTWGDVLTRSSRSGVAEQQSNGANPNSRTHFTNALLPQTCVEKKHKETLIEYGNALNKPYCSMLVSQVLKWHSKHSKHCKTWPCFNNKMLMQSMAPCHSKPKSISFMHARLTIMC